MTINLGWKFHLSMWVLLSFFSIQGIGQDESNAVVTEMRVWTSSSGSTLNGMLIAADDEGITLIGAKKKVFNMTSKQLSEVDQKFAENWKTTQWAHWRNLDDLTTTLPGGGDKVEPGGSVAIVPIKDEAGKAGGNVSVYCVLRKPDSSARLAFMNSRLVIQSGENWSVQWMKDPVSKVELSLANFGRGEVQIFLSNKDKCLSNILEIDVE